MFHKERISRSRISKLFTIFSIFFIFVILSSAVEADTLNSQAIQPVSEIKSMNTFTKEAVMENSYQLAGNPELSKENSSNYEKNTVQNAVQYVVVSVFTFFLVGVTVNYGFRMYWNSPLHPSFMPFVFVAVAAILAFTVIIALDIAVGGTIEFEFVGQKFRGASGPVVLWVLTFLSIIFGLRLSGATNLAKSDATANPPSHRLLKDSDPK
jgi:hypothetical protein